MQSAHLYCIERGAQTLLWKQLARVPVLSRLSLQPAPSVRTDWTPVNQTQCSCGLPSLSEPVGAVTLS